MTQLAVKALVEAAIDNGVDRPTPLSVQRQRPKQDVVGDQSVVVVWIKRSPERRLTMPKGVGSKMARHQVVVMLFFRHDDAAEGGDLFDTLKGQCLKAIRDIAIPSPVVDPLTGEGSNVVFLSEEITPEDFEPVQDEGMDNSVVFTATISFTAEEIFQA